jgi:hypothetical protein
LTKIILFLDILKFPKKNQIDIWFLEKLGIDCISFYETVSSLLKTIGTSLEKKSQQRGTGHSSIQNFLFKTTENRRLVTKSKNHTTLVGAPYTIQTWGLTLNP